MCYIRIILQSRFIIGVGKLRQVQCSEFAFVDIGTRHQVVEIDMGTRHQQYSSMKVHFRVANGRYRIICLVVSFIFAIATAIAFLVLFLLKSSELLELRMECTDATCVRVAAGNLFTYSQYTQIPEFLI